jgi:integrase
VEHDGRIRNIAAVRLMLNTGLRVAEFCGVHWKNIRLSDRQGTLTVERQRKQTPPDPSEIKMPTLLCCRLATASVLGKSTPIFVGQRGPMTTGGFQILLAL